MSASAPSAGETTDWNKWLTIAILVPAAAYIMAAYSSLTRPIWIDEFLHYALGSHRSTAEAWLSINDTLPTFNHGQTGVHIVQIGLAATVTGALAFYLAPVEQRTGCTRVCGGIAIGLGVLFQPFFPIYWLAIALYTGAAIQSIIHGAPKKSGAAPTSDQIPTNNDEWVVMAIENIASGGPVWPMFRRFCARND